MRVEVEPVIVCDVRQNTEHREYLVSFEDAPLITDRREAERVARAVERAFDSARDKH